MVTYYAQGYEVIDYSKATMKNYYEYLHQDPHKSMNKSKSHTEK